MIDPDHVTNFARTQAELEEFLCFAVLAANRDARLAARVLTALLDGCPCTSGLPPLTKIARTFEGPDGHTRLAARLAALGMGLYSLKAASLFALARSDHLELSNATTEALERFRGIGPKTARFFILHSRPNAGVAALDVHLLRRMREDWGLDAPAQTPPAGPRYRALEAAFLAKARELGRDPAELDLESWRAGARRRRPRVELAAS